MKHTKKTKFYILLVAILTLSFVIYKIIQPNEKKVFIKLKFENRFGKLDNLQEEMLGLIMSFSVDKYQNVYIGDDAFKVIKKFSKNGKFIRNYGFGAGKGPGEFSAIHQVSTDSIGNIYAIDKINLNISVFDSLNHFIVSIKVPFFPAQIISVSPMLVDISGFPFTYTGDLIYRYNLLSKNPSEPVLIYGKRLSGEDSEIIERTGNSGRLTRSKSGNIYYAFYYPYEIRRYSESGKLLGTIKGNRKLKAPILDPSTGNVRAAAGIQEFVILQNDILMVLIDDHSDGEHNQYFDFYDGIENKFLGSVSSKSLGLNNIRFLRADSQNNIYMDMMDPFPHIDKYKIEMEFK